MMLALFWGPQRRWPADALMLALFWGPQRRWPADAHDAGPVLVPSRNVSRLMLMMLALFWGPPKTLAG